MRHYGKGTTEIRVRKGETFVVALESLPSAGYVWSVETPPWLRLVTQDSSPRGSGIGAAADDQFTFHAAAAGEDVLVFKYGRPWEKTVIETLRIRVVLKG